jgi:hypothetical protein
MAMTSRVLCAAGFAAMVSACTPAAPEPETPPSRPVSQSATPTFINRVWRVSESKNVAPGTLYVFLSDGTLVIAANRSSPMIGRWSTADGGMTLVEEGVSYATEVLSLTPDTLRLRISNPKRPVDLLLVPAAQ